MEIKGESSAGGIFLTVTNLVETFINVLIEPDIRQGVNPLVNVSDFSGKVI
jgi:hypothetical protein